MLYLDTAELPTKTRGSRRGKAAPSVNAAMPAELLACVK